MPRLKGVQYCPLISYLIILRENLMPHVHIRGMSYTIWRPNIAAHAKIYDSPLKLHSVRCFKAQLALVWLEFWILTILLSLLDKDHSNTGSVFVCSWR